MANHLEQATKILDQPAEDIGDDEAQTAIAHALVSIATSLNKIANNRRADR